MLRGRFCLWGRLIAQSDGYKRVARFYRNIIIKKLDIGDKFCKYKGDLFNCLLDDDYEFKLLELITIIVI